MSRRHSSRCTCQRAAGTDCCTLCSNTTAAAVFASSDAVHMNAPLAATFSTNWMTEQLLNGPVTLQKHVV
jgi:hypothetical protein